jgi:hypothetical protein
MIHYHGTPITPRRELHKMAGRNFCVSFSAPQDADWCISHGQSVMLDNGAFSQATRGKTPEWSAFYAWAEPRLAGANWAVVPDVIGGDVADNVALINAWPLRRDLACLVWHMDEPIDHLIMLADMGFGKVAFGSSGRFWQVGSQDWQRRADMAFDALAARGNLPWVHMMRGLSLCGARWPFASADSTNVARNHASSQTCPAAMAERIDAVQSPITWAPRPQPKGLFDAT